MPVAPGLLELRLTYSSRESEQGGLAEGWEREAALPMASWISIPGGRSGALYPEQFHQYSETTLSLAGKQLD